MILWGINAMNHDASISAVDSESGEILFAGHAERYSRVKNDPYLNWDLIIDAAKYGTPERIVWFENPWGRRLRYLKSGQERLTDVLFCEMFPKKYMSQFDIHLPISYSDHHASHAAGGFFTSGFHEAAVLVIDAIGEITTASIWKASGDQINKVWQLKYPHSIGLFYSAMTQLVGLKPNEEEYILMGMAAHGDPNLAESIGVHITDLYFKGDNEISQSFNFHQGLVRDEWLNLMAKSQQGKFSIALATQNINTTLVRRLVNLAKNLSQCHNLVYSGGVALNCVTNTEINGVFDNVWIMPNPGDAGNSLGAVANYLREHLVWRGPFLGHDINRHLDVDAVVNELMTTGICGVANGRAEFGPRALGNRSLLADPRREDMKDRVNEIKHRQKFRPFAPAVLEQHASECFDFGGDYFESPYMQFVVRTKNPEKWPAIAHVDNTSRVQTVNEEVVNMHAIITKWYEKTGCPMLLNTSLNIKGEPLVNSLEDAIRWQQQYGVKVF